MTNAKQRRAEARKPLQLAQAQHSGIAGMDERAYKAVKAMHRKSAEEKRKRDMAVYQREQHIASHRHMQAQFEKAQADAARTAALDMLDDPITEHPTLEEINAATLTQEEVDACVLATLAPRK